MALPALEWPTPQGPLEVADHRQNDRLVILAFGDSGTGHGGQYRVGNAMYQICRQRACDLALMMGDNIYENGIAVTDLSSAEASLREIRAQFEEKFEGPYQQFEQFGRFDFWAVLGNHDYRRNSAYSQVMYTWESKLWRTPAYYFDVPYLPDWIQIYGIHTDTDEKRDFNGLQVGAIRRALCDEKRDPERWKLVFGHQPLVNHGHHESSGTERRMNALFGPAVRSCGVDVYLAGHAHHQEHITLGGYEQIIQGAAGKSKGGNSYKQKPGVRQRYFAKDFGFAILEATRDELRIDFYSVAGTAEKMPRGQHAQPAEIQKKHSAVFRKGETGKP
jgi:predicted phosphodiesterase